MRQRSFSDIWEVSVGEHDFLVHGTFNPAEKDSWSEWDGGTQGNPAYIEIEKVFMVRGKKQREIEGDGKAWYKLMEELEEGILGGMCAVE